MRHRHDRLDPNFPRLLKLAALADRGISSFLSEERAGSDRAEAARRVISDPPRPRVEQGLAYLLQCRLRYERHQLVLRRLGLAELERKSPGRLQNIAQHVIGPALGDI